MFAGEIQINTDCLNVGMRVIDKYEQINTGK